MRESRVKTNVRGAVDSIRYVLWEIRFGETFPKCVPTISELDNESFLNPIMDIESIEIRMRGCNLSYRKAT